MTTDLRREADELARYWGELGRRVAPSGVTGLGDVLGLQEQLRRALEGITPKEIAWAQEQAARLVTMLEGLAEQIRAVREAKEALDGPRSA